jgi:opacity protein-like surface antigen
MKLSLFATAAVAAAFIAAPAVAQPVAAAPSNYVQFNIGSGIAGQSELDGSFAGVGAGSTDIDLDAGLFASAAAGHAFGNGFALELEGVYAGNDGNEDDVRAVFGPGSDASVSTLGALVNAKYEFNTGWNNVSPYVGAGIGYGNVNIDVDGFDDDQAGFMWQAKAGIVIQTNEQLAWDIGYRYLAFPQYDESTAGASLKVDTAAHVLSAGARVSF